MKRLAALMLASVLALSVTPGTASQIKRLVAASTKITTLTSSQVAAVPNLAQQNADVLYKLPNLCGTPTTCVLGDASSKRVVVVYGDSHARMWLPSILGHLTANKDRVVVLGRDGCWAIAVDLSPKCTVVRNRALAQIASIKPMETILSDYTGIGIVSVDIRHPTPAAWKAGLEATLRDIKGRKLVIGDITQLDMDPVQCLAAYASNVQRCSVPNPNKTEPTLQSAEIAATKAVRVPYVDPRPWFCATRCSPVIGQFLAYWSSNHVTVQYAEYLSGVVSAALTKDRF